jgi:hypothetical protein
MIPPPHFPIPRILWWAPIAVVAVPTPVVPIPVIPIPVIPIPVIPIPIIIAVVPIISVVPTSAAIVIGGSGSLLLLMK